MKTSLSPFRSIKARVTLFTLLVFVASLWTLSLYASRMLRDDIALSLANPHKLGATCPVHSIPNPS